MFPLCLCEGYLKTSHWQYFILFCLLGFILDDGITLKCEMNFFLPSMKA